MKIKSKRSILTAILTVLFAAAAVLGVAFALPKTQIKSATAATNTPEVNSGITKYYYGPQINNFTNVKFSYSSDLTTDTYSQLTFTAATNKFSASSQISIGTSFIITPLILSVTVPAHTAYTVDMTYQFQMNGRNGRAHGMPDLWTDDPTVDLVIDLQPVSVKTMPAGLSGQTHGNPNTVNANHGSHLTSNGYTFYNDTATDKVMEAYSYYFYLVVDGTPGVYDYTGSLEFTNFDVTVEKIGAPTTTATTAVNYDGTDKTFNIAYDAPEITKYNTVTCT
ncbi:MAG: hypothetical protein K2K28_00800, partial [Clostridia bacterium]|nr:hypothetical protein [Clostridia bacterium]